jgi:hypothetical protein
MKALSICRCPAYTSPHFMGLGVCVVEDIDQAVCTACLHNCQAQLCDDGVGPYEYWGQTGFDSRPYAGSDCCEAAMVSPATGNAYQPKPDGDF